MDPMKNGYQPPYVQPNTASPAPNPAVASTTGFDNPQGLNSPLPQYTQPGTSRGTSATVNPAVTVQNLAGVGHLATLDASEKYVQPMDPPTNPAVHVRRIGEKDRR